MTDKGGDMNITVTRAIAAVLAGISLSATAQADDSSTPAADQKPIQIAQAGPAAAGSAADTTAHTEIEGIVVTGSRVRADSSGFEAPTPVTVLSADVLSSRAATNIADALNTMPQFAGSATPSSSLNAVPATSSRGNLLNLRGLGFRRVLVMVNGARIPPTQATGGVDLNLLPEALVERVDIVTGGASAAYGSDAVSGVVNYILDRDFTGFKSTVQAGTSRYGDNDSYKVSLTGGTSFLDERIHLIASFTHDLNEGMERDRYNERFDPGVATLAQGGNGTAASPFFTVLNARYRTIAPGGLIVSGPLANNRFLPGGGVTPFDQGTPVSAQTSIGGDGGYYCCIQPVTHIENDTGYLYGSFDITDDLKLYASAIGGATKINATTQPPVNFAAGPGLMTIFNDNAFLQPAVRAALGATPSFSMSRISPDWGQNKTDTNADYLNARAGLEGRFAGGWDWDVGYSYGVSKLRARETETYSPAFFAALDSVVDPSGNIVCRVNLIAPGSAPGCVPLNVFGEGAASPAAIDYIKGAAVFDIENEIDIVSVNVRGDLGRTWAGPISAAFGAEYRTESLEQTSNSNPAVRPDYTGIRGVPAGALWYNRFNVGLASGELDVTEGYAELLVPLARDAAWASALDLNAAVRYTDYSTSGDVVTWKGGLTYAPVDQIRFRGTMSRDIAAPSLFDLFAGQQITISGVADAHTGVTSQTLAIGGGNPDLTPEEANTFTAGIVYSPSWMSGLRVAVDYYSIEIEDAISAPNAAQLIATCEQAGGTGPACDRVIRPLPFSDRSAANYPTEIRLSPINQSQQNLQGIDLELQYGMPLGNGQIFLSAFLTRLLTVEVKATPTVPFRDDLGYPVYPELKGSFSIGYRNGPLSLQVLERFTGDVKKSNVQVFAASEDEWPNLWYTDLSGSYNFTDKIQAFLNVRNLFDRKPPIGATATHPGFLITQQDMYDVIGTYGVAGVRVEF